MPETTTPPAAPTTPPATPPVPTPPPAAKQPPWGDKPENFDADKAWEMIQTLKADKNAKGVSNDRLDREVKALAHFRDTMAAALGVKPEETSDADKLAAQIQGLQGQILASEKRALAIEFHVPEAMLTAPDATALRAQATSLAEFAQAAHYAAATAAPTPPPAFQANPGQGQGNAPLTPEAQAAAEYEAYYPSPKPR